VTSRFQIEVFAVARIQVHVFWVVTLHSVAIGY